jgi:hypothetical protein
VRVLLLEINKVQVLAESLRFLSLDLSSHVDQCYTLVLIHHPLLALVGLLHFGQWLAVHLNVASNLVFFHSVHFVVVLVWIPSQGFIGEVLDDLILVLEVS